MGTGHRMDIRSGVRIHGGAHSDGTIRWPVAIRPLAPLG